MEPERLFCRTLDDLAGRADSQDEYDVLFSAALVRKLLMDDEPLMHQVNRTHRLPVRFAFNGPTQYEEVVLSDGPVFWSLEDALDPECDLPPGLVNRVDGKLDNFLARRVMRVQGHDVSVRDLVAQLAHIEGAVHAGVRRQRRRARCKMQQGRSSSGTCRPGYGWSGPWIGSFSVRWTRFVSS